jgi:hypothetical protein
VYFPCVEKELLCNLGWEPTSLEARGSPLSGVLQEIQLGEKRCHDLKLQFSWPPLRGILSRKARSRTLSEEKRRVRILWKKK